MNLGFVAKNQIEFEWQWVQTLRAISMEFIFSFCFFHFIFASNWLLEIPKLQMQQNETESREKPICLDYC